LKKIADALGVELYELFEGNEGKEPDISGYIEVKGKGIFKIGCFEDLERISHELK